jgi:hypothetical protein
MGGGSRIEKRRGLQVGDKLRELRLTNRGLQVILEVAQFGGSPFGELPARRGYCFSAETRLFPTLDCKIPAR